MASFNNNQEKLILKLCISQEQINQLHKLSVRGDVDSFRLLLDRKDLILSRDRLGATPLHKAVIYGHFELIEFISTNYPNSLDSCDHVSIKGSRSWY